MVRQEGLAGGYGWWVWPGGMAGGYCWWVGQQSNRVTLLAYKGHKYTWNNIKCKRLGNGLQIGPMAVAIGNGHGFGMFEHG